jgi:hypothetical protein
MLQACNSRYVSYYVVDGSDRGKTACISQEGVLQELPSTKADRPCLPRGATTAHTRLHVREKQRSSRHGSSAACREFGCVPHDP